MVKIYAERRVHAPKDKVWDTIADFPTVMNYNPLVPNSYLINNTPRRGLGAERHCDLNSSGSKYVEERVIRYDDEDSYDIDMYGGNQVPPVNNFVATLGVRSVSANETIVYMQMTYNPKRNPMLWLMGKTMIPRFLNNAVNGIVDGVKYHVETGNTVHSFDTLKAATATA